MDPTNVNYDSNEVITHLSSIVANFSIENAKLKAIISELSKENIDLKAHLSEYEKDFELQQG